MTSKADIARRSLSAAKYSAVLKFLSQTISLPATAFLVIALSEHDYGIYNLLYSVIGLLSMAASFGLANTLQRYIPEYYSRGEYILATRLYRISSFIRLVSNVIILGLLLILWDTIAPFIKLGEYRPYFLLFTVVILLHLQWGLLQVCLDSYFLQKYTQFLTGLFMLIKAIGYAVAIWFNLTLWHIITIDLLAYTFLFVSLQVVHYKKIPHDKGSITNINHDERKRLFRYAAYYNFNDAGSGFLETHFDNFILALYMTPASVGAYAFCNRLAFMLQHASPVNYLIDVIRPTYFSLSTVDTETDQAVFLQSILKMSLLFYVPMLCFILLYYDALCGVFFGGKYIGYTYTTAAIFLFMLINSVGVPAGLIAQWKEKADIILYSKIFAIYNIMADIILIKYLDIWGAVIAHGTANLFKNIFIWYSIRQHARLRGLGPILFKLCLFWASIAAGLAVSNLVTQNSVIALISGSLIFAVGFILQFRLKILSTKETGLIHYAARGNSKLLKLCKVLGIQPA